MASTKIVGTVFSVLLLLGSVFVTAVFADNGIGGGFGIFDAVQAFISGVGNAVGKVTGAPHAAAIVHKRAPKPYVVPLKPNKPRKNYPKPNTPAWKPNNAPKEPYTPPKTPSWKPNNPPKKPYTTRKPKVTAKPPKKKIYSPTFGRYIEVPN